MKSYLQGLWLTATTMFAVLYGDYVPTSHIARFICYALGLIGLLISASITAMFARAMQPSDFEAFAMQARYPVITPTILYPYGYLGLRGLCHAGAALAELILGVGLGWEWGRSGSGVWGAMQAPR